MEPAGVMSSIAWKEELAACISSGQFLSTGGTHNPKVHLFSNNTVPNQNSTLATFTECVFTGYAAVDVAAWSGPILNPNGTWYISSGSAAAFIQTATTADDQAYGWFLTDANLAYVCAALFPSIVVFNAIGCGVTVVPTVLVPN